MNNLYLIGFRGVGKSTIAPMLAQHLGWSVVELDELIETHAGASIADIFKNQAEDGFRDLETSMLRTVARKFQQVISTGGGIVLRNENRQLLRSTGTVVWLQASADTIFERLTHDTKQHTQRPALTSLPLREEISQLISARSGLYAETAHFSIDTESHKLEEVVGLILKNLDLE